MKPETTSPAETVLIVDDDVRVVELLQITLSGRGYQVLAAYDGENAVQMVQQRRPDCVVLDVRLPRKSGFEVLDLIRRDPAVRHLPVILISGDAATETRLQGLKLGADDYLAKPFSPRELIIKLRRILDRLQDHNLLVLKAEALQDQVRRGRDALLQMRRELSLNLTRVGGMLLPMIEMNRASSLDAVLERFVGSTAANLDFAQVALCVVGPDGVLLPRAWRGIDEKAARALTFRADGALARLCVAVARPLRLDELEGRPDAAEPLMKLSAAGVSLLVPVLADGRLRALMLLGERGTSEPLGLFDLKLFEILSEAVVAALQNVEVLEASQRRFLDSAAGLIANLEERHPAMKGHSARVAGMAERLGRSLCLGERELEVLRLGALLHDLGQLDQAAELWSEGSTLTPSDRRTSRRKSADRADRLLGPEVSGAVGKVVRHCMEYWDGSGLPQGLRESEIPLGARIVALVNAWDALTHDRPHRKAFAPAEALSILRDRAGKQFDPDLVPALTLLVETSPMEAAPSRT